MDQAEAGMPYKVRDLVKDWRADDAHKLVVLENESAVAWPGGGGWQATADGIERWFRDTQHIGIFVVEEQDRIISICTLLSAPPGQKEHSFIPHLNCHPDYHGKGYGKAALHAAVESAFQNGFGKVDLGTWAGNMKAVPLYKKSGFMWKPDTSVGMENFTPSARRHPLGASFFKRHNWYDTLERTLDLQEDLVKLGKVRVYEYRWRAENGDFLRMVFDSQSWRPVRWRVVNKKSKPVHVSLNASGDPGVGVQRQQLLEVSRAAWVEGTFEIDPQIAEKERDPKAALLHTRLDIGGRELELSAGISVQKAVDISLAPTRAVVAPNTPQEITLSLSSNLEEKATVQLSVVPLQNASLRNRQHAVVLNARRGAELKLEVTAGAVGHMALEVQAHTAAGRKRIPIRKKRLDLLAVEPAGTAAAAGQDHALLASGGLMLAASRRDGHVQVYDRLQAKRAHRLSLHTPRFGPPFSWQDLFLEKGECVVDGDAIRLSSRSIVRPGVVLDRRIRILHGTLVEVVDTVVNGSPRALQLSRIQGWHMSSRGSTGSSLFAPRENGVHASTSGVGGRGLESISSSGRSSCITSSSWLNTLLKPTAIWSMISSLAAVGVSITKEVSSTIRLASG